VRTRLKQEQQIPRMLAVATRRTTLKSLSTFVTMVNPEEV
jgi:hypothetical protein